MVAVMESYDNMHRGRSPFRETHFEQKLDNLLTELKSSIEPYGSRTPGHVRSHSTGRDYRTYQQRSTYSSSSYDGQHNTPDWRSNAKLALPELPHNRFSAPVMNVDKESTYGTINTLPGSGYTHTVHEYQPDPNSRVKTDRYEYQGGSQDSGRKVLQKSTLQTYESSRGYGATQPDWNRDIRSSQSRLKQNISDIDNLLIDLDTTRGHQSRSHHRTGSMGGNAALMRSYSSSQQMPSGRGETGFDVKTFPSHQLDETTQTSPKTSPKTSPLTPRRTRSLERSQSGREFRPGRLASLERPPGYETTRTYESSKTDYERRYDMTDTHRTSENIIYGKTTPTREVVQYPRLSYPGSATTSPQSSPPMVRKTYQPPPVQYKPAYPIPPQDTAPPFPVDDGYTSLRGYRYSSSAYSSMDRAEGRGRSPPGRPRSKTPEPRRRSPEPAPRRPRSPGDSLPRTPGSTLPRETKTTTSTSYYHFNYPNGPNYAPAYAPKFPVEPKPSPILKRKHPGDQRTPRHVDELMASLSDSEEYHTAVHSPKQAEPPRDSDKTIQQAFIDKEEQKKMEMVEAERRVAATRNIAGPPVYYPPSYQQFDKEDGEFKAKHKWMEKSKGKSGAWYKAKQKAQWGEKEKSGVVAVPVCLPLCCGAACSVM